MRSARLWAVVLAVGVLGGCEDSDPPVNPLPDSGTVDSGTPDVDGGTQVEVDAGTDAGSLGEPLPCEKTQGVCSGARRAVVDGAYEPVCTARSYGSDYEASETRCDSLDNDCDGVTDPPPSWSEVASLGLPMHRGMSSSLRVADGVLSVAFDREAVARVIRLDTALIPREITEVPVEAPNSFSVDSVSTRLLRTPQGPAMYYSSAGPQGDRTRGHLILLDEQGHRVVREGEPETGALLFDQAVGDRSTAATVSADGTRIFAAWRDVSIWGLGAREVRGTLTGLDGQVVVAPRVLMRSRAEGMDLHEVQVLGLRDGGFLVMVQESDWSLDPRPLRLQRFDSGLQPVGEERVIFAEAESSAQLVELGAAAGGALESPVIVLRDLQDGSRVMKVLGNLFGELAPRVLGVTTPREAPWFGTAVTSRGLQVAWLSVGPNPQANDSLFRWQGRFWAVGDSGVPADLSPGPEYLPLHRYAQWVQLEELPDHWMGALVMTSTESPQSHTLRAVRYCAP